MSLLFFLVYNILQVPLFLLVQVAGLFNIKLRRTLQGRRRLFPRLRENMSRVPVDARRFWIHISSMGEFEQGLPLIEELAARYPNDWFIISLFSPSAFDHVSWRHPRAVITYLPLDSYCRAKKFIEIIRPSVHIIIRHDIWPNFQWLLQRRHIPSLLISAGISDERFPAVLRFKFIYRQIYATFSAVCVVSALNEERLRSICRPSRSIYVCGDTRYDRVHQRALDTTKIDWILRSQQFRRSSCLVAGSTWPSDDEIVLPALLDMMRRFPEFKLVLAPHEMDAGHLQALEQQFLLEGLSVLRLSAFEADPNQGCRALLIDRIGLLANLYALGQVAIVGGGFGPGVHNVLEPAAHGCVVCCGPRHLNSPEAREMISAGVGLTFASREEFATLLQSLFANPEETRRQGETVRAYILKNVGAAKRTADVVARYVKSTEPAMRELNG
jgi:3-deoxy-D-manno-octulosonic-acid transferase